RLRIHVIVAVGQNGRDQLSPTHRANRGRPVDAPALDVADIKVGIAGMIAVGVQREPPRRLYKFFPSPRLIWIVAGRFNAFRLEDVGVVVDVRRHPAGTDTVPTAVEGAAIAFLGLDKVILLS